MSEDQFGQRPPYVSYRTFTNFINGLRENPIPTRIDGSVLSNLSGSSQSSLINSLRYMRLIDDEGTPSPFLVNLVAAENDERRDLLREILTESYRFIWSEGFDLRRATPGQLRDKMREQGVKGSTLEKAIAFFLAAAKDAGLEVSPHITQRKRSSGTRRTRRAKQEAPHRSKEKISTEETQSFGTKISHRTAYQMLIEILDANMDEEEKAAVWTLIQYLKKQEAE